MYFATEGLASRSVTRSPEFTGAAAATATVMYHGSWVKTDVGGRVTNV